MIIRLIFINMKNVHKKMQGKYDLLHILKFNRIDQEESLKNIVTMLILSSLA